MANNEFIPVNLVKREDLIEFLTGVLIPDLLESGSESTAEDLIKCVIFMKNPTCDAFDISRVAMCKELWRRD